MRSKRIVSRVLSVVLTAALVLSDGSMVSLAEEYDQNDNVIVAELEPEDEPQADKVEEMTETGESDSEEPVTEETDEVIEDVAEAAEEIGADLYNAAPEIAVDDVYLSDGLTLDEKYPEFIWSGTVIAGLTDTSTTDIVIPEECTNIVSGAFRTLGALGKPVENDTLKSVDFSNATQLQTINANAFQKCTGIAELDLSYCTSLTNIGSDAFSGCTGITSIKLPENLHKIEARAFSATSITDIVLVGTETEGLTEIGDSAFLDCEYLTTVYDNAKTLNAVGTNVFKGCHIQNVEFADYIDNVPAYLFNGAGISTITIPAQFTEIGASAFENSTLVTIEFESEDSGMVIGDKAFSVCKELKAINLPNNLTSIGSSAFLNCQSINEVVIPDTVNSIGTAAFSGCSKLTKVTLPSKKVNTIPASMFAYCSSLGSIVIPDNYVCIDANAFLACSSLSTVDFSENLKTIGDNAFKASGLIMVDIPASVSSIGASCFQQCLSLVTVSFPEQSDLATIGKNAFYGNISLSKVELPEVCSLSEISQAAFSGCTLLRKIVLPDTVKTVGIEAFKGCSTLQQVDMESVTVINKAAFQNCILLIYITQNNEFLFSDELTTIGQEAFSGCESIKTVVISESIKSIGKQAFYNTGISTIVLESADVVFSGEATFGGEKVTIKGVEFPEGITAIPDKMFYKASFMNDSKIVIPETVTSIGAYAFCGEQTSATNLVSIEFKDETKIESIGDYAFAYCSKLKDIIIPSGVKTIGKHAFDSCQFTGITIPEQVTTISEAAFANCNQIKNVEFAGTDVETIGISAFAGCTSLERMMVPAGVSSIGKYAYNNCTSMSYIHIPSTVESINDEAFSGCNLELLRVYAMPGTYAHEWAVGVLGEDNVKYDGICSIEYVMGEGNEAAVNNRKNPSSYVPEYEVVTLFAPTLKNYAFEGWYKDANFEERIENTEGCTGDITVYAKWEYCPTFDLSYVLRSGTKVTNFPTKIENLKETDEITLPSETDVTRSGYILMGWSQELGVGEVYEPGSTITIKADGAESVKMNAVWGRIVYKVSYGKFVDGFSTTPKGLTYKDSLTLPSMEEVIPNSGYMLTGYIADKTNGIRYELGQEVSVKDLFGEITGDVTLTLTVEIVKEYYYTVKLNENAKDAIFLKGNEISAVVAMDLELPSGEILAREGYDFLGWYSAPKKPASAEYITVIPANTYKSKDVVELYAIWGLKEYKINYHLDDDVVNSSKNPEFVKYTKKVKLSSPKRKGYTFAGWYEDASCTGTKLTQVNGNAQREYDLYAKWTLNKYSLVYNINGGVLKDITLPGKTKNLNADNTLSSVTITDVIQVGNTTIRPGYTFEGWSTDKTATIGEYAPGESFEYLSSSNNATVTLYATWKPISYTIEYVLNDDEEYPADNSANTAVRHDASTKIKLESPKREGYTFAGWYLASDFSGKKQTTIEKNQYKDVVLYAKWTENKYTLSYNINGGAYSSDKTIKSATISTLAKTTKNYFDTVVLAGNDVSEMVAAAEADKIITSEEAITINAANTTSTLWLTKKGYVLTGWNTAKNGRGTHFDLGATVDTALSLNVKKNKASVVLYAEWTPVDNSMYSVTYHVNGGTLSNTNAVLNGEVYEQLCASKTDLSLPTPVKPGYTFGGWYTADNGQGTRIKTIKKNTTRDYVVYAKWTENKYKIKYDVNGGKKTAKSSLATVSGITYTGNVALAEASELSRSRWEFLGWSTVKNAAATGAKIYAPGEVVSKLSAKKDGSVTLYAQWKKLY